MTRKKNETPVSNSGTNVSESQVGIMGDNAKVDQVHINHNYQVNGGRKGSNRGNHIGFEKQIQSYCRKAEAFHENLPVAGFATHLKVPIDLEDIYIPLRAMLDLRGIDEDTCFSDAAQAESLLKKCNADLEIPLIDAFKQIDQRGKKGLVILGDPGSGKTTHLKRTLLWCLRKGPEKMGLPERMLPVFLPLRELKDTETDLGEFIHSQLTGRHLKTPKEFGHHLLERGNLLFLLDGLDEVADLSQREQVVKWIEDALLEFPDCRFVVTSRFSGYVPSVRFGEKIIEMHVRPLSEKEAEKFVRNWYAIVERSLARDMQQAQSIADEKAERLIKRLRESDFRSRRVFELTRNPLLLTNICLVHRHRGSLPKKRARLYRECIDVLLEHWREAKGLTIGIGAEDGRRVLQPVAYWLHQEDGRTRATAKELAPIIEPALDTVKSTGETAEQLLKIVRDESGLLTGWDQEHYGFIHLGFQEYLAAREIQRLFIKDLGRTPVMKQLAKKFGDSWWQEVILLTLALEDHSMFEFFMQELIRLPVFADHSDLVEMCLDETSELSLRPFIDILTAAPTDNMQLWKNQLLALRILKRLDKKSLAKLAEQLRSHPYDKIRRWMKASDTEQLQDIIKPDPSGYELVRIPAGKFMMGSKKNKDEGPEHEVHVPEFYIGKYPVTNEEYGRFLAENTGAAEPKFWGVREYNQPRQPVVGVSWEDAQQYARWAGLQLPSEAQWEYACRAGTQSRYYSGNTEKDLDRVGWYEDNSGDKLHPVGAKEPNQFGLYDMHGNVWEWVEDDWHKNYKDAPDDGRAWIDDSRGSFRVFRGGSWPGSAWDCRSAYRFGDGPGDRYDDLGFRLVLLPGQAG